MGVILNIAKVTLEEGFMYAILAMGLYITYSILDFPDLSVDGSFPLGAIVSALLIIHGCNPWLSLLIAFACGALAGIVTGLLHIKLHIRPLLCGILVYTGMLSINLVLLFKFNGGSTVASFFRMNTVFNSSLALLFPERIAGYALRILCVSFVLCMLCKLLLDLFLKTQAGLLLRATGNNESYVRMLAQPPGFSKALGLSLGNGLASLAGAVVAQAKGSADQQMGVGMVVLGLASVIIGLSLFRRVRFLASSSMVILGSLLYKVCLSAALALGLPTEYLKLLMTVIFTLALVFSQAGAGKGDGEHA